MVDARPLLERLMSTPDLARIVPKLPAGVLLRVIERAGLEDCAELVAMATPQQLSRVLDSDLWRASAPGAAETLDVDRFGLWLDVLMQAGADVAARTIAGLDLELVAAALARHVAVFDVVAVSELTTLDGERMQHRARGGQQDAEIGGYAIEARSASTWDAIVELLGYLAAEDPRYFGRLMRRCVRLSSGPAEVDGAHDLLDPRDQQLFDLQAERETRRTSQGYVTPAEAHAFLQGARALRLDADPPPHDPVWRAHLQELEAPPLPGPGGDGSPTAPRSTDAGSGTSSDDEAVAVVLGIVHDAGEGGSRSRALLSAPAAAPARLDLLEAYVDAHLHGAGELAFLANALLAGCTMQQRALTSHQASAAAAATCNLGLENWPERWAVRDLVTAFQVGWTVLHRDVSLFAARHLIDTIGGIHCSDRDIQLQLRALARALVRHVRDRAPWRARGALDVILTLDAPSWAGVSALLDECPALHAAVRAPHSTHQIDPAAIEFIAHNRDIEAVRSFLEGLPSRLVG